MTRRPTRTGGALASNAVAALALIAIVGGCANTPLIAAPGPVSGAPTATAPGQAPNQPGMPVAPPPAPRPAARPEAGPASSPPTTGTAALGRTVSLGATPGAVTAVPGSDTVAVATVGPAQLLVIDPDTGVITSRNTLPGAPARLAPGADAGGLLVPTPDTATLNTITLPTTASATTTGTRAETSTVRTGPGPRSAVTTPSGDVWVALADPAAGSPNRPSSSGGSLAITRGDTLLRTVGGLERPNALVRFGTTVAVLDTATNTVGLYDSADPAADTPTAVLPAGDGPTDMVVDRHGRLWITDIRAGALLGYDLTTGGTPLPRVALPTGTGPYAAGYDPVTDRLWITLTATNQVIGYDLSSAAPRELLRLPTIAQPDHIGLGGGRLYIASPRSNTLQILTP